MMDEELKAHLDAMESRFMRRINDNHETLLRELRNMRSEHDVTRRMVMQMPGTVVSALEAGFIDRMTQLEDRMRKLEGDKNP